MTTAIISAVYLGLLCSVSPCPLATNIAAVSFISRKANKSPAVFHAGLLYMLGRFLTFCILGFLLSRMLHAAPTISHGLQKYMNMFLGPCMILIAMFLLKLLNFPSLKGINFSGSFLQGVEKLRGCGAVFLGIFSP